MTESQYRTYKIYVGLAFAAVLLSIPLAFVLPVQWSSENGIIENAQVVALIIAAVFILNAQPRLPWFQRFCAAGLVLMALRELSWGRVFFPIGMEDFGPIFVDMADYEYRVHVYVFISVYISAMLVVLVRFVPVRRIFFGKQPLAALAVMALAALLNFVGDHGYILGKGNGQILEELNELIFYATTPAAMLYWLWQQKNPSG